MAGAVLGDTIDDVFDSRLGKKLALIEELRLNLGSEGIQCPGVLVVGAQSAGKSSVLERLTSIRFPRSQNTCTRVPTIVQLHTTPNAETASAMVSKNADFSDAIKCEDMKSLEEAILELSSSITKNNSPIADLPIHIRYIRNKGPVMTLIDLPGITHVNVDGHDDFDIHEVTSSMVHKYVKNENMVVLVVIPANDDFGNAEALRIAQLYDKDGKRTIGVVSKCDLVPDNSDILHKIRMARQSDVKLALGFIAVRNKGLGEDEEDIEKIESKLFATHPLLKHLDHDQRGYSALTRKIVDLQSQRVDKFIPEAKRLVLRRIKALQLEQQAFGQCPTSISEKRMILTGLLCNVQDKIYSLTKGEHIPDKMMNISARSMEFCEQFSRSITDELPDTLGEEFAKELLGHVQESKGSGLPNFISDPLFRRMVKEMVLNTLLEDRTEVLISDLEDYMKNVYVKVINDMDICKKHESFGEKVSEEVTRLIEQAAEQATVATNALVSAEKSQIFTQNPTYMEEHVQVKAAIVNIMETTSKDSPRNSNEIRDIQSKILPRRNKHQPGVDGSFIERWIDQLQKGCSSQESTDSMAIFELQLSIYCYVDVMLKRLFDVIPMIVRDKLIYQVRDQCHRIVQEAFDIGDVLDNVLHEKEEVTKKRKIIENRLTLMKFSLEKLRAL